MHLKKIITILALATVIGLQMPTGPEAAGAAAADPASDPFDPVLVTTAAAAVFGHKEKKIVLIDVRPKSEFEQYHIAGSLNIPLHGIKAKVYLKSRSLVLVNEGFAVHAMAQTCQALNKAGFKATLLAGGLPAWKEKGGRLVGDPFAQRRMNRITAGLFARENANAHLVVIDASRQSGPSFPGARPLPLLKSPEKASALKRIMRSRRADPFVRLVILTDGEKENDRIQRGLAGEGIRAYFLTGGRKAYEKHMQYIQMARRPAAERKVTAGGCKTCVQDN